MQESVIYQDILQEGLQKGRQGEGRSFILRQLTHKFGEVSSDLGAQIEQLSLAQLEELGEALLDFSTLQELNSWLDNNRVDH